jgi:CHAT domain-containing protein
VYNMADPRYRGKRGDPELSLARLPNTARELDVCARAWHSPAPRLLSGTAAGLEAIRTATRTDPAIIHFATHVVTEPGELRSGLIALSLDSNGAMGLLGPKEIAARPVRASLVVMDGCHSAQGEALPSAGLMGLTRAWIGAGARAVIATQWDLPDDDAQSMMGDFYSTLRASRERGVGFALREAQLAVLKTPEGRRTPSKWAGYFLLSRIQ